MKNVIQISFPISCVSLLPVANFNCFDTTSLTLNSCLYLGPFAQ